MKEKYQPCGEEIGKVREVLGHYNEQLRAWFLQELPHMAICQ